MRDVKVDLNSNGVRALLRADGVRRDLERRAGAIAAAAGDGMLVKSDDGRTRARASVVTGTAEAMLAESHDRSLSRSLDAGR